MLTWCTCRRARLRTPLHTLDASGHVEQTRSDGDIRLVPSDMPDRTRIQGRGLYREAGCHLLRVRKSMLI